jgi:MT0933-like antitoxin protein
MNFGEMKDKATNALDSEKGEKASDKGLEKAEQFADERTGGTHTEQLQKGEQFADKHVGEQQG